MNPRARVSRLQAADRRVEPLRLRLGPGPHIDPQLGAVRHDVAHGAAVDHVRTDRRPRRRVLELDEPQHLPRRLDHGVDAELGRRALVGGAAVHGDDVLARAFAGELEVAPESAGFEHQHDVGAARRLLDGGARRRGTDLLVRVQNGLDVGMLEALLREVAQEPDDEEHAAFHVVDAGPERAPALDAPQLLPGPDRPHRVVMPDEEHAGADAASPQPEQWPVVGGTLALDLGRSADQHLQVGRSLVEARQVARRRLDGRQAAEVIEKVREAGGEEVEAGHRCRSHTIPRVISSAARGCEACRRGRSGHRRRSWRESGAQWSVRPTGRRMRRIVP